jgi:hypothetical protein
VSVKTSWQLSQDDSMRCACSNSRTPAFCSIPSVLYTSSCAQQEQGECVLLC